MADHQLTRQELEALAKRWGYYGLTLEQGLSLRRRAKTDLFFLCRELLGYIKMTDQGGRVASDQTEFAHAEVCHQFFVQKDPDAPDFETFARNYDGLHDRLLWLTRYGYKSTMDIADAVQWIICFPNIRINLLTGVLGLAQEFLTYLVGHFTTELDGTPKMMQNSPKTTASLQRFAQGQLTPSLFQILFPEFCDNVPRQFVGNAVPHWTTPARRDRTVATIRGSGLETGKTGTHCDIALIDDVLTPETVGTGRAMNTNLKNIGHKIAMFRKLRADYGFTNMVGTPQHALDYNSQIVKEEDQRRKDGRPALVRVMVRPAMVPIEGHEGKTLDDLTEDQVTMWCPSCVNFASLKHDWQMPEGRDTVATQNLLDVSLKVLVKFQRELLVRKTIPPQRIPSGGLIVIPWDLAYSTTDRADFTVGLPAKIAGGRFYVLDKVRGRYNEDEIPRVIAQTIYRWNPDRVAIENSQGAKWLRRGIEEELEKFGMICGIEYVDIGQGIWRRNEVNAGPVVRMLGSDKLYFSLGITAIDELYDELEAFPNPSHKDDIVATLNLLVNYFMNTAELTVQEAMIPRDGSAPAFQSRINQELMHESLFGYGRGVHMDEGLSAPVAVGPDDPNSLLDIICGGGE